MILKSYFDGGNQADGLHGDCITLATACGTGEQWDMFESAWNEVLQKHNASFLHTTEAVSLQQAFHKDKGWNRESVDALISDCVDVISAHLCVRGPFGGVFRSGLNASRLRSRWTITKGQEKHSKLCQTALTKSASRKR